VSQTNSCNAQDPLSVHQTNMDSMPSLSSNDDSALIALGQRFEEILAEVRVLYSASEPEGCVEELEATLARLEPVEQAIMTMTARTIAGLGVKARHAAFVMSELWNAPIDRIDWDARAVRLLIEAVCEVARARMPCG
jgi:hypothetical protein